jgi:hypothetical protein
VKEKFPLASAVTDFPHPVIVAHAAFAQNDPEIV